jgi:hypothetical protein
MQRQLKSWMEDGFKEECSARKYNPTSFPMFSFSGP